MAQRLSLTKAQLATESGAELLWICKRVTTDGRLSDDEIAALQTWIAENEDAQLPAALHLRKVLEGILADGVVTPDERTILLEAIERVMPPSERVGAKTARRHVEGQERAAAEAERAAEVAAEREELDQNDVRPGSFYTKVVGVTFTNDDGERRQNIIASLCKVDMPVVLVRDPGNQYDRNAVAVWVPPWAGPGLDSGRQIGHLNAELAAAIAPAMDRGMELAGVICDLTGGQPRKPSRGVNLYLTLAEATARGGLPEPWRPRPRQATTAAPCVRSELALQVRGCLVLVAMMVAFGLAMAALGRLGLVR